MVKFPVRNSLSSSSLLIRLQINFHIIYFSNHFPYYYFNSRENDSLLNIAKYTIYLFWKIYEYQNNRATRSSSPYICKLEIFIEL